MACNIAMIGGGSFLWTERFAIDFFLKPSLRGSRLTLVDIDRESRDLMAALCRKINGVMDAGWTIETAEMDPALRGADYVVVSISTGGLDAFDQDYRIPEKYGIFHSVGDTVGPAGISRTLRNVPVFRDLAVRMERLCPSAWMIHVTNPLAQLTRCVAKTSPIRVVGLCHNYEGAMRALAEYLGAARQEVAADTVGVNHFTWLKNLTCRGESCDDRLSLQEYLRRQAKKAEPVHTGTTHDAVESMTRVEGTDNRLSFELFERFGYFPVNGAEHVVENFPYYLNDLNVIRRHRIRRKGVLPNRREGWEKKQRRVRAILDGRESPGPFAASHEMLADIVEALHTGVMTRAVVNLPNTGQIENLPRDAVVETWASIEADRITPCPVGPVPVVLKGLLESIIAEEELAVEAALTGDRRLVYQAMQVSPMVQNKDTAAALADELLAAQAAYLPQFSR